MTQVRAKKYLGQHFLKDLGIARRIVESLPLRQAMPVLEVGPGMGVLTQFLLQNPLISLTAVEIDTESVVFLQKEFPQLNIVEGDFLKIDLRELYADKFCIIGNFPYNISSQIFFKVLEYKSQIPYISCLLQKEVAERIASKPGKKAYGILSVLMQAYYEVEYLFTVSEQVFDPPPKVKSAVVRFTRNEVEKLDCDEKLFRTVVKTAFNQRRKILRNSLSSLVEKTNPIYENTIYTKRPEQLDVQSFVNITNDIDDAMLKV
ncbi:MAG: 16S rRNA (adenine(1518)-N(6)/adenine(1519)-N(6))-dimethyltransferase RsmA [Porphyromonadaceae bacterium]|jgi:16S rRNA (adenine1518-N6/adenine1519-N6)-dimethyltransferase|nr:16S rRNA (adenine(1518)-N(6)/adenine(1519)-N(6))-dimethyltransferase RsmA [Porphyromonadaceae bacterium]